MPNTESTILENWPDSKAVAKPTKSAYHFALCQGQVNLDFHLARYFVDERISNHFFDSIDNLIRICQRYPIDAIMISGKSDFTREIELVRAIKQNMFMSIIPVILYHPDPDPAVVIAAFEKGAEEFIHGDWMDRLVQVRIKRVLENNRRDLSVNATTRLPGPALIEHEISHHLAMKTEFAVCYADLDNFKAYNDYYGYAYGDRVIRLTARIIRDVVFDLCREGFVGHVAGDDFIYLVPKELVEPIASWIIKCFDAFIYYRYELEDRERGYIETISRRGELDRFDILTISIAIVITGNGNIKHVGQLSRMLADLKKAVKSRPGSTFMIERRKPY